MVAVLGCSLWGNFAQTYAARNPGRVSGVIAFGPAAPADTIGFILSELYRSLGDWNWLDEFAEIDVPVLIVHGDQDTVIPEGGEADMQALADVELVVVEDTGHMGFIEQPERHVRIVDTFLDSPSP